MKLVQLFIKNYKLYAMFVSMLNFNRHSILCSFIFSNVFYAMFVSMLNIHGHSVLCSFIFSNMFYVHSCITRCLLERPSSFQVILMIFLNYHADDYDRSINEAIKATK
jgi:hypothetical protein